MDSSQENFPSFPELDNLIDAALNQVQEAEPLMGQLISMDEATDSRIIITTVGVIGAIAIGLYGLNRFMKSDLTTGFKEKLMEWYRSVINFLNVPLLNIPY